MTTDTDTKPGNDVTDPSHTNQDAKTFTQDELDTIVSKAKAKATARATKEFEGVNVDEYKQLKDAADKATRKEQIKKGEFDTIMEETATKHNTEIAQYKNKIHEYTINTPIITAAANLGANHPDQVRSLIKGDFRLSEAGDVEVVDKDGKARYNDDGKPFTVNDRVREYLDSNPHFVQPTPSTTNTQSNKDVKVPGELDITKLDMKNQEDRKKYAAYKKSKSG